MEKPTAQELIDILKLKPLPGEGGLFRQTYLSSDMLPPGTLPRFQSPKPASTAIFFLLTNEPDSFSALHRLPTDEVYHFYLGDPVEMLILHPVGVSEYVTLGQDVLSGQLIQFTSPAGAWQGSHLLPGGSYALLGTTMAPGFTPEDFVPANRDELLIQYPHERELILRLTRT